MGVALVAALAFSRLRLPSIAAYIIAGVVIEPYLLGWIADPRQFSLTAEFGVVFSLFSLGLEFSLPRMLTLKRLVFGLGGAQVLVTTVVFATAVFVWGAAIEAAIIIAGALALSSTAIVTRELGSLQQFDVRYAQLSIAILLFQDLIAVVFLILVPVLAGHHQEAVTVQLGWALLKDLVLLVVLMIIGKWVLPLVYQEVANTRSDEVFVLTTLVIALLAAWLTHSFGLSLALGGFVIGMMLGEGPFKHQIDTEIRPFKDVLLGLFFVTVGMAVDLTVVVEFWWRILVFTLVLLVLNVIIVTSLARSLGKRKGAALRVGITLAQAGEFGLALLVIGLMNQVIPPDQGSFIMTSAVLSMLVSPFLIRRADWLAERVLDYWPESSSGPHEAAAQPQLYDSDHVIIGGFGRAGQAVAHLLNNNQLPYIAIDSNARVVKQRRLEGDNVVFGDCANVGLLEQCHLDKARLATLTFRSPESAKRTIARIRDRGLQTPIIVRCSEHMDFEELISLGADHVIPEMLGASLLFGTQVLSFLDVEPGEINRQINELRDPFGMR